MKIIPRSSLHIPSRQRSTIVPAALRELRDSIVSRGLFHPPVVRIGIPPDDPLPYVLVAGERRTRAIDKIAEEGIVFQHDDKPVVPGELPVTFLSHDEAVSFLEAELEENLIREDLPWQDRIRAIATIHRLRVVENPTQTPSATARELADRGGIVGVSNTVAIQHAVSQAAIIAPHLSDPAVANARNAAEAYVAVARKEEAKFNAEIVRRRSELPSGSNSSILRDVRCQLGDLSKILPNIESNTFDLILCDPPYGIGADAAGFRSRSAIGGHQYADGVDSARTLIQTILNQGLRLSKPRSNLFMFLDIDLFSWAKDSAAAAGWTVFRTPLTWIKSDSEGLAPWGSSGPRRTIEWIMYATKGQRGLVHSPVDGLRFNRVARNERDHGAEKPVDLLQYLIECSTIIGEHILDPCCGTGSSLVAAKRTRRRATGIEIDPTSYGLALGKIEEPIPEPIPLLTSTNVAQESAL